MSQKEFLQIPVADKAWLIAQLTDAINGGKAILPYRDSGPVTVPGEVPPETAVIIHTSGSSGVPKFVAISRAALRASAAATNEKLAGAGQWLVALPTHLISGMQMLTRSILSGTTPIFYSGTFKAEQFFKRAAALEEERRYTSLVPMQLAALLDYASSDARALHALKRFDAILVGGQATSLALRQRAFEAGIKIVRTYGMTETAGGTVYDGVEIGDTQMRIRDGEVQLAGSSLALGYLGNDKLTAQKFVTEGGTRWFRTGDRGSLLGGTLSIEGRIDRVIVSGGSNVSLDQVERIAAEFEHFEGAVAVGVPNEKWGSSIVLVREGTGEEAPTETVQLQEKMTTQLGSAAKIQEIISVEKIARLAGGKPDLQTINKQVIALLTGVK